MPFAEDVYSHRGALFAFAVSLSRNRSAADDLVSETVCKALECEELYCEGNLRGWLLTVMRNVYVNEFRKRRREQEDPDGVHALTRAVAPEQFWRVLGRDITAALGNLSPREQTAVLMVCHEGCSYEDTAAVLGVGLGAFKTLLRRAKLRLQELLSDDDLKTQPV